MSLECVFTSHTSTQLHNYDVCMCAHDMKLKQVAYFTLVLTFIFFLFVTLIFFYFLHQYGGGWWKIQGEKKVVEIVCLNYKPRAGKYARQ